MAVSTTEGSDATFFVELEEFSGPLDLLLTLIRQQEIDITDIPIARITDQFLDAIASLGLNQAAEYLDMAALLLRIKIQVLLPRPLDDADWEDPRAELVRRLLEYEQIKEVVVWISARADYRSERFPRGWSPPDGELPPQPVTLDFESLLRAANDVIAALPRPVIHRVLARPLDIEGARVRITEVLRLKKRVDFIELLGEHPTIADVISSLLVLLEMARHGEVRLAQAQPFGKFEIVSEATDQPA